MATNDVIMAKVIEAGKLDEKYLEEALSKTAIKKRSLEDANKFIDVMARKIYQLEAIVSELKQAVGVKMNQMEENINGRINNNGEALARLEEKAGKAEKEAHTKTFNIERRQIAANLIIKKLPGEGESKEEMTEKMRTIFDTIGAGHIRIKEAIRFKKKDDDTREWFVPIVKVVLEDAGQRAEVFRHLSNLRGTEWNRCSVSEEHPECVKEEVNEKNYQAMCYRHYNPTSKTRIKYDKVGYPQLQAKMPGEAQWSYPAQEELKRLVDQYKLRNQMREGLAAAVGPSGSGGNGNGGNGKGAKEKKNANSKAKRSSAAPVPAASASAAATPATGRTRDSRTSQAAAASAAATAQSAPPTSYKTVEKSMKEKKARGAAAAAAAVAVLQQQHDEDDEDDDESGTESELPAEAVGDHNDAEDEQ